MSKSITKDTSKWIDQLTMLIYAAFVIAISNYIQTGVSISSSFVGTFLLIIITLVGMMLSEYLPLKLPAVFWVSILAILVTCQANPIGVELDKMFISKVDFLAIATAILSYAGLALGKSMHLFKELGWKIIIVALAVYTGTFVCAMLVAEIVLRIIGTV